MTITAYEIPLQATPQSFGITLNGVQYQLAVLWCSPNQTWVISIFDSSGNPIVTGIPMVTGVDLLSPYAYLGLGGQLIAQTDNEPSAPPTFTNLGATGHLYFVTEDN